MVVKAVAPAAATSNAAFSRPLLDARRRALALTSLNAMAAFDPTPPRASASPRRCGRSPLSDTPTNPPARRALEAELVDLDRAVARRALERLSAAADEVRTAPDDLRRWRQWAAQLRSTFETADRVWMSLDAALDATPLGAHDRRHRHRRGRHHRVERMFADWGDRMLKRLFSPRRARVPAPRSARRRSTSPCGSRRRRPRTRRSPATSWRAASAGATSRSCRAATARRSCGSTAAPRTRYAELGGDERARLADPQRRDGGRGRNRRALNALRRGDLHALGEFRYIPSAMNFRAKLGRAVAMFALFGFVCARRARRSTPFSASRTSSAWPSKNMERASTTRAGSSRADEYNEAVGFLNDARAAALRLPGRRVGGRAARCSTRSSPRSSRRGRLRALAALNQRFAAALGSEAALRAAARAPSTSPTAAGSTRRTARAVTARRPGRRAGGGGAQPASAGASAARRSWSASLRRWCIARSPSA